MVNIKTRKWAYYNDNDPNAVAWIKELIRDGLVPDGEVDSRSILDIDVNDVLEYSQQHYFAGILGWPLALQMAGWGDRPVVSASLPCQPFSTAGKRKGKQDERHLFPVFATLMEAVKPDVIFGEQVASKAGREWYGGEVKKRVQRRKRGLPVASECSGQEATTTERDAGVRGVLQGMGFRVGAVDWGSPVSGEEGEGWAVRDGVPHLENVWLGAPHIRQRLYWVAERVGNSIGERVGRVGGRSPRTEAESYRSRKVDGVSRVSSGSTSDVGGMADTESGRTQSTEQSGWVSGFEQDRPEYHERWRCYRCAREYPRPTYAEGWHEGGSPAGVYYCHDCRLSHTNEQPTGTRGQQQLSERGRGTGKPSPSDLRVGDTDDEGRKGRGLPRRRGAGERSSRATGGEVGGGGWWSDCDLIHCKDGKTRRIPSQTQSGVQCVVDGLSEDVAAMWTAVGGGYPLTEAQVKGRIGLLRGYGNAIVPPLAAEFIRVYLEVVSEGAV